MPAALKYNVKIELEDVAKFATCRTGANAGDGTAKTLTMTIDD